jgi:hypothetical protein
LQQSAPQSCTNREQSAQYRPGGIDANCDTLAWASCAPSKKIVS